MIRALIKACYIYNLTPINEPGCIAQSVTCLEADMCLTADPVFASLIPAQSHTFVEIDHEIISTAILLPSTDSRRVVVIYKREYVHKVLINQEKVCLGKLTVLNLP